MADDFGTEIDYDGSDFDEPGMEGTDDGDFEDIDVDYDDADGDAVDDEWGWTEGLDAKNVEKTWKQYTQTREDLKRQEQEINRRMSEIEPFMKLREEIVSDPGLVQVIEEYLNNARPVDREVQSMKQELSAMKTQMMTENELDKLETWIDKNEYPKVSREEILQYAVDNQIPNLQVAYKDKFFDELRERRAKEVTDGIKRSKGAASIPRKRSAGDKRKTGYTQADLTKMSDEDFIKNYSDILKSFQR